MSALVTYGRQQMAVTQGRPCVIGREGTNQPVDIRIPNSDRKIAGPLDLSRQAVVVGCPSDEVWTLQALSPRNGVKVLDYTTGSLLRIPPGDAVEMPKGFTDVNVVIVTDSAEYEFNVQVISPLELAALGTSTLNSQLSKNPLDQATTYRIDTAVGYFRALLVLCEPKLENAFNDRVPSESEIRDRLVSCGLEPHTTTALAIQKRLESLRKKLELPNVATLRDRVIESGAVTAEDLKVLKRVATS